ncbi:MAG: SpoIIE family protein phosphatase [Prevotella sp.]|nr:SpoIIE family protein phosphatase [Prevotella sp.]
MIIVICAAFLILLMIMAQYYYTRDLLRNEVEQRANIELSAQVNMIEHTLESAEVTMQDHLWEIQKNLSNPDELFEVTRRMIAANQHVVGGCLSFVPNYFPQKGQYFEPYAHKENGEIVVSQLGSENHDYTQHPAYIAAVKHRRQLWSDPYVYEDGKRQYLTTFTYPLIDSRGEVACVCGLDIDLSWLNDTLNHVMNYPSSFGLMLTQKGELVVGTPTQRSSMRDLEMVERVMNDYKLVSYADKNGDSKIIDFTNDENGRKGYIYFKSLSKDPYWKVAMVTYEDEVFAAVHKMRWRNMLMLLGGLIIISFIINRFARNEKRLQLANLREARIGSELRVARAIQEEMLPKVSLDISQRPDIDVCGSLEPAKEVGGDVYDYLIRDEKLFFCIGDVSGKGVPAAMVMSVILSLFRMFSSHSSNPAHIVQALNEELCRNNESNMFVTFFIGVLDLPTGRLRYCNAGHEIPLLIRARKSQEQTTEGKDETGQLIKLPVKANLPMGVFNDFKYEMQEEMMESDSVVFLYTDGLTESRNPKNEQFKLANIMNTLRSLASQDSITAQQVVTTMNNEIIRYMDKTEQADDLTMLAVHFVQIQEHDKLSESITLQNDVHQVSLLNDFVKNNLTQLGLEKSAIRKLQLAIEEVVANVIDYAYPIGTIGDIKVDMLANDQRLKVVVCDEGVAFDPTVVEKADTSMAAEDRPVGGLGILLTRELVDSINYERVDGRNILTLRKKL